MQLRHKTAINPLPWILAGGDYRLDEEILGSAMRSLSALGYTHITVELPAHMSVAAYRGLLSSHALLPAPGYFSAPFYEQDKLKDAVEAIKRHAAVHAELGLDSAFIATDLLPERMDTPAVGVGEDDQRDSLVADGLATAAEAAASEGVRYGLHPHVGSAVEVESEIRRVLDATAGSALWFGPDTGHLLWGGTSPEQIVAEYADRVLNVHLKDVDARAILGARLREEDYFTATGMSKVWVEPGRGEVNFDAVLDALPADFAGWFVIEVDVPNHGTPPRAALNRSRSCAATRTSFKTRG